MVAIQRALPLKITVSVTIVLERQVRHGRKRPSRTLEAVSCVGTSRIRKWPASLNIDGVDVAILLNGNGQAATADLTSDWRGSEVRIKVVLNGNGLHLPQNIAVVPIQLQNAIGIIGRRNHITVGAAFMDTTISRCDDNV